MRLAAWFAGSLALFALVASAVEGPAGPMLTFVPSPPPVAPVASMAVAPVTPPPPAAGSPLDYPDRCEIPTGFTREGARSRTADALEAGLVEQMVEAEGATWIGKMASVGGGARDVILWMPDHLYPADPVEVVIFMDGYGSFADGSMARRHAASIHRLAFSWNGVYVAPDAPSSTFAKDPRNRSPYWRAGAKAAKVDGPGDFVAFLDEIEARIHAVCPNAELRYRLVGFSNGGRGVRDAVRQLAGAGKLDELELAEILFADGNYGSWMADTRRYLGDREVDITLVRGRRNQRRAIPGIEEHQTDDSHDVVGDEATRYLDNTL